MGNKNILYVLYLFIHFKSKINVLQMFVHEIHIAHNAHSFCISISQWLLIFSGVFAAVRYIID